jgi:hypothetical protein
MLEIMVLIFGLAAAGSLEARAEGQMEEPANDTGLENAIPSKVVAAMDEKSGGAVNAGVLITAGGESAVYISRNNQRIELSPRSMGEFDEKGGFRLLRGSAYAESTTESSMNTSGARLVFVGKALVSYDHNEKSTSAFVLEGEARLENAHRNDSTVRLQRYRGATLVVGDVLPRLVRQLDVGAVQSWLKGYSWPEKRSKEILDGMPGEPQIAKPDVPKNLEDTKIADYFSSIETADEFHQPDYYAKKFEDPDKAIADANSKHGAGKRLSPEEAALISLPKTQIDLGFDLGPEFLTADQKAKEVSRVGRAMNVVNKRTPASVSTKAAKAVKRAAAPRPGDTGDSDVNLVLERLRQVRAEGNVSEAPARTPASVDTPVVPDPVYDYSQNF